MLGHAPFSSVHSVILRDKVRNCEIHKALNVEPLLRIQRSQGTSVPNAPEKIVEASPAGYTHGKTTKKSPKDQVE